MAKKTNEALAKSETSSVTMAAGAEMPADWLSEVLGDEELDVTGTEEMDQSDVRLPTWLLNSKKEDVESGRACPDDVFWNSLTERGKDKLRLVVLTNHKSRMWRESDSNDELVIRCKSWDGETGVMDDGEERPCKNCPDYKWQTDDKGKRFRRCTDVHNVLAMDRESREIGVLKIKKTALRGWKDYYQQYFHRKRARKLANGQTVISDVPFFAAETIVEAEVKKAGGYTWYVPRFSFGGALPKEEILAAAEFVKAHVSDYLDRASKTEADTDEPSVASGGSDVIDAAEFSDDGGGSAGGDSARF
jgi:hypothetical protein